MTDFPEPEIFVSLCDGSKQRIHIGNSGLVWDPARGYDAESILRNIAHRVRGDDFRSGPLRSIDGAYIPNHAVCKIYKGEE